MSALPIVIAMIAILFILIGISENWQQVVIMKLLTKFCLFEACIFWVFFYITNIEY